MNATTKDHKEVKQGWMMRLVAAVCQRLFSWLCLSEMGMSPYESQIFMLHFGTGWEEAATYHYIAQTKHYQEQI